MSSVLGASELRDVLRAAGSALTIRVSDGVMSRRGGDPYARGASIAQVRAQRPSRRQGIGGPSWRFRQARPRSGDDRHSG